jgi:hypothetical protein
MNATTDIKKYEQKEVCVKEDLKKIQFRYSTWRKDYAESFNIFRKRQTGVILPVQKSI